MTEPSSAAAMNTAPALHQLTCVVIGGRGVLIAGAPGSGKSSLALAVIDRGARLVGDDGVTLACENGVLIARPAPATRGLIEVRGVGIVPIAACDAASVALLVKLDPAAPRYIETAPRNVIAGVAIPEITLWPDSPWLALRAEMALAHHGLTSGKADPIHATSVPRAPETS